MSSLCFLPLVLGVQSLAVIRSILCTCLVFWIALSSHSLILPGINIILNTFSINTIILPLISIELMVNTFLLVGLSLQRRLYLVPWVVLNLVLVCGLLAGVVFSTMFSIITEENKEENVLGDIKQTLLSISLLMLFFMQMLNLSAVLKVFIDMKEGRRVSFSNMVEQKEISRVNTCENYLSSEVGGPSTYVTMELGERGTESGLMFTFDSHKFD